MIQFSKTDINNHEHLSAISNLVKEYFTWGNNIAIQKYGYIFDTEGMFQEFMKEIVNYTYPNGIIYLIKHNNKNIGIGGFKRTSDQTCELKRVYIQEQYRGNHLGRRLLKLLIEKAKEFGYNEMQLESARFMTNAFALYTSLGFKECELYQGIETPENHQSITYCMKMNLKDVN